MLLQRNVLVEVPSVANATPNSLSFPATKREELILTKEKSSRQILLEKRKNVLKEILVTERNYVCDLSVLVCLFLKPLQVETVLPKDDIELIFLNIEVIYKLSHEFLMQLETVFKDPDSIDPELSLGTILIQIGHFLKMYSAYCANCKTGMEHNAVCVKTNPDYAQYLKDTQSSTECKGLSLNDYLIKPVQRICKYPLLFEELAKSTPIDHPDYNAVLSTQSLFQTVAEMTNRNSADKENMEKLVNFVAVVDGFHDANHFKCGRQVLLDEWLQVITPKTSTPGSFHIYLFSDQLVITKRVRRKSTNASRVRTKEQKSERLKHQLNLKSYYLGETVEDNKNGFTLTATNNENMTPEGDVTFTFICPSPGSKTKWMDDLKRLVGETPSPELGRPTFARKRSQRKLGKPELLRSKSKELLSNRSAITSPPEIKEDKIDKEKSDLASRKTLSRSLTTNLEPSKPNRLQRKVSISNVLGKHVDKPEKAGEKAEKLVEKVETPEILTKLSEERKKMSKTNRDRKSKEIEKFRKTLTAKSDGAIDDKISHPSDQECLDEINSLISSIDTTDPKLTETKSYKDKPSLRLKRSESKFTSLRAGYDSVRDKRSDDEKLRKSKSLLRLDVFSQGDDKKTHSQASLPELEEEKPKKKEKSKKNSISFSRRSSILLPELPADDESATPRTWRDPKAELNTLNEAAIEVSTVERSEEKDSDEIDEKNPKNKFCLSSNISEEVNGAESDNEDYDHSIVDNPVVPAKDFNLKTSAPERTNRYSVYQFAPASLIQQDFSQMGHMIQMPQIPQVPLPGMMPHLPNQIQNNQMSKMHPYLQATPFSYLQPSLAPMAINNDMYHHISTVPPAYYPSHPYLGSVYIPPTQICARCNILISEGSASIFFHNRNYHANCYLCSHCNVSLIENKPHEHNKGLYCEECHHALNMDFSPVSNKQRTVLKHHQDNL